MFSYIISFFPSQCDSSQILFLTLVSLLLNFPFPIPIPIPLPLPRKPHSPNLLAEGKHL